MAIQKGVSKVQSKKQIQDWKGPPHQKKHKSTTSENIKPNKRYIFLHDNDKIKSE